MRISTRSVDTQIFHDFRLGCHLIHFDAELLNGQTSKPLPDIRTERSIQEHGYGLRAGQLPQDTRVEIPDRADRSNRFFIDLNPKFLLDVEDQLDRVQSNSEESVPNEVQGLQACVGAGNGETMDSPR